MRTNIDEHDQAKTYTGDPREWPNGVYKPSKGSIVVQVMGCGVWSVISDRLVQWSTDNADFDTDIQYTRVPGFTGGIAAIEFEREGA